MEHIFSDWKAWVEVGIILVLAGILLRLKKFFKKATFGRGFEKFFTLIVLFITLLLILQILGINIIPILTLSGIGAAIVGFASKDVIANFFSGLMIYVTKPFVVDDYIEVPEKKIAGNVEEIGWYLTSIRDAHKRPLYVPNSIFSTELLINHSRITHRRIDEKIRIRAVNAGKAKEIIAEIRSFFERQTEIDAQQPIDIYLLNFNAISLEIEVKAYTRITEYEKFMEFRQKILLEVYQIAFPTEKV